MALSSLPIWVIINQELIHKIFLVNNRYVKQSLHTITIIQEQRVKNSAGSVILASMVSVCKYNEHSSYKLTLEPTLVFVSYYTQK